MSDNRFNDGSASKLLSCDSIYIHMITFQWFVRCTDQNTMDVTIDEINSQNENTSE